MGNNSLDSYLNQNINKPIELSIYNVYSRSVRIVKLTPKTNWGGNGALGASISIERVDNAHERVYLVLSMYVGSPMHSAGLISNDDYIIGTPEKTFESLEELQNYIKENENKEITFMVFSKSKELIRQVKVTPCSEWNKGTEVLGLLGGVLANGKEDYMLPMKAIEKNEIPLDKVDGINSEKTIIT